MEGDDQERRPHLVREIAATHTHHPITRTHASLATRSHHPTPLCTQVLQHRDQVADVDQAGGDPEARRRQGRRRGRQRGPWLLGWMIHARKRGGVCFVTYLMRFDASRLYSRRLCSTGRRELVCMSVCERAGCERRVFGKTVSSQLAPRDRMRRRGALCTRPDQSISMKEPLFRSYGRRNR